MGIFAWIVFGILAGAAAKWFMPGPDGGGIIMTMLLGIAGAMVGGFIGSLLGLGSVNSFDIRGMLLAIGGGVLILFLYRKFKSN